MKKFVLLVLVLCLLMLNGCCMSHEWGQATCEAPKACTKCGETEGTALGHSWKEATCETAKTCTVCGVAEGAALGHSWVEATCETPKNCSVCAVTEGDVLGHNVVYTGLDGYQAIGVCSVCSATISETITDAEPFAYDFLVGNWTVYEVGEFDTRKSVGEAITFEFREDGTMTCGLPENQGQGTFVYTEYLDFMGHMRYEAYVNGKTYDIVLYTFDSGEMLWWYRDAYKCYFCHKN